VTSIDYGRVVIGLYSAEGTSLHYREVWCRRAEPPSLDEIRALVRPGVTVRRATKLRGYVLPSNLPATLLEGSDLSTVVLGPIAFDGDDFRRRYTSDPSDVGQSVTGFQEIARRGLEGTLPKTLLPEAVFAILAETSYRLTLTCLRDEDHDPRTEHFVSGLLRALRGGMLISYSDGSAKFVMGDGSTLDVPR
jgi:hypothetical protein